MAQGLYESASSVEIYVIDWAALFSIVVAQQLESIFLINSKSNVSQSLKLITKHNHLWCCWRAGPAPLDIIDYIYMLEWRHNTMLYALGSWWNSNALSRLMHSLRVLHCVSQQSPTHNPVRRRVGRRGGGPNSLHVIKLTYTHIHLYGTYTPFWSRTSYLRHHPTLFLPAVSGARLCLLFFIVCVCVFSLL